MTRSQRHKIAIQNTSTRGEIFAQGRVAPGVLLQAPAAPTVPVGPAGGPLKGSSMMGAVPIGWVSPTPHAEEGGAQIVSLPSEQEGYFPDPLANPGERSFPIGPFTVNRIDDHADGIAIELVAGVVHVGDTVLVEASGNTSINGEYPVLAVDGLIIVVDNPAILSASIEARGRLTITGGPE